MSFHEENRKRLLTYAIGIPIVLVIAFGANFAITGGDFGCMMSKDPALCAAVKGVGR